MMNWNRALELAWKELGTANPGMGASKTDELWRSLRPCPVVTNHLPNDRHYTFTGSSLPLKHLTHVGVGASA